MPFRLTELSALSSPTCKNSGGFLLSPTFKRASLITHRKANLRPDQSISVTCRAESIDPDTFVAALSSCSSLSGSSFCFPVCVGIHIPASGATPLHWSAGGANVARPAAMHQIWQEGRRLQACKCGCKKCRFQVFKKNRIYKCFTMNKMHSTCLLKLKDTQWM